MSEYINRILCFFIFTSVLNNLLSNKGYQKYIRLFSGFLLVMIILSPVIQIKELSEEDIYQYFDGSLATAAKGGVEKNVEDMREQLNKEQKSRTEKSLQSMIETRLSMEDIPIRKVEITYQSEDEEEKIKRIFVRTTLASREREGEIQKIVSEYVGIPLEAVEVK